MVLPYEIPLNEAHGHLDNGDIAGAESAVEHFFANLESDEMVKDIRRQHLERQVFEADFLSILTKHEIQAWAILAVCRIEKRELEAARDACHKQLELIDEFYGFQTPSWQGIETRIPLDPELVPRYALAAELLAEIFKQQKQDELSERWRRVKETALSDRQNPDEVWERWLSAGEDGMVGRDFFELITWSVSKVDLDGHSWIVQLDTRLGANVSPLEFSWLATIDIPTEEGSEVPSKGLRWRIWGLRQAICASLRRSGNGVLAVEAQRRGLRKILFYVRGEEEARAAIAPIIEKASEIKPLIELCQDLGWQEYVKWGGQSVVLDQPSLASMPPETGSDRIEDLIFRTVWKMTESVHDSWVRFYNQSWLISHLPPADAALREFCVNQLFHLAQNLQGHYRIKGLIDLVWHFPAVDREAAVRAFEKLFNDFPSLPPEYDCELNLAGEELAQVDTGRALAIAEKLQRYSLVQNLLFRIVKVLAHSNQSLALSTAEQASRLIHARAGEDPYFKCEALVSLASEVFVFSPELAEQIVVEAELCADAVDGRSMRHRSYACLSAAAATIAPGRLKDLCAKTIEASFALEEASDDWIERTGPYVAARALGSVATLVASYDRTATMELLSRAMELALAKGDIWEHLETVSDLAISVRDSNVTDGRKFPEKLWELFTNCMPHIVNMPDPYIFASQVTLRMGLVQSIKAFVSMNPKLAAQHLSSILTICSAAALPEMEVKLLCTFATHLGTANIQECRELLGGARRKGACSSAYLKAVSFAQIITAMAALKMDLEDFWEKLLAELRAVPGEVRYEAVLEIACLLNTSDEELSRRLLQALATMQDDATIHGHVAISRLNEMPVRVSGELMLRWLKFINPADFIGGLCQWANKFVEINKGDSRQALTSASG